MSSSGEQVPVTCTSIITTYHYSNGAQVTHSELENDDFIHTLYNTGDHVWFKNGEPVRILTHDFVEWIKGAPMSIHNTH